MGDISSGMASTVIQLYIKDILDAFLHQDVTVRKAALKVIQLILQQGLVHPVQVCTCHSFIQYIQGDPDHPEAMFFSGTVNPIEMR